MITKQDDFIRKLIREELNKLNEEVIVAYRGGGDLKEPRRLWYFTTNIKYANWFKKRSTIGNQRLFKIEVNIDKFLDLRFVKKKLNYLDIHYILKNNGINIPKFVNDHIFDGYGNVKFNLWEFLKSDNELWDNISEKYNGVIFYETNPEAKNTGRAETIVIDMFKHPIEYTES
jgi:hypothetical protein